MTDLRIVAVGDVIVNREQPETLFDSVGATLRSGDITFGNLEAPYSESATRNPITRGAVLAHPRNLPALKTAAGFNVMSFANNHHLDYGYDAFHRTLELLREQDIATCGVGVDIDEARKPAIIERNGVRVAFLGYATVMFLGYEADVNKPGAAPLRAFTVYHQSEEEQPGTPPDIFTYANRDDLLAMQDDVRRAKEVADVVVFSCHWGLHFVRSKVADYERELARAAIDAGADVVLGHHQHILKGIDSYRGKLIFHGLNNFAMDVPDMLGDKKVTSPRVQAIFKRYPDDFRYNPEDPGWPYRPEAKKTMIVVLDVADGTIGSAEIIPCQIQGDHSPRLVDPSEPLYAEAATYLEEISAEADLRSSVELVDGRIVVRPVA